MKDDVLCEKCALSDRGQRAMVTRPHVPKYPDQAMASTFADKYKAENVVLFTTYYHTTIAERAVMLVTGAGVKVTTGRLLRQFSCTAEAVKAPVLDKLDNDLVQEATDRIDNILTMLVSYATSSGTGSDLGADEDFCNH
eukprot:scaffold586_cov155-Amphora_coffeaeformis.AAC.8